MSRLQPAEQHDQPESAGTAPEPLREPLWREVVGRQLRALRHERGDSLQSVAARARVSPQYLSEVERGHKEPSSEILAAISASLERTLLDLATAVADQLRGSSTAAGPVARRENVALAA